MHKNNEIEALRAIGIVFVILAHLNVFLTWNPSWISLMNSNLQFWGGVDLFFCVSGYVITKSIYIRLLSANGEGRAQVLKSFWIRRAFRLLPASLFFISLTFVLSIYYNVHGNYGLPSANFTDIIAQIFQVSNFRYHYCSVGLYECGKNSIYWSLSLEEQFYLLMPLIVLVLKNKTPILLLIIILIQFTLTRQIFSLPWMVRTDAIAWGCLIAIFSNSEMYKRIKPLILNTPSIRIFISSLLILSLAFFTHGHGISFNVGVMAVISAIMVFISSYDEGYFLKNASRNKIILWIGSRSYSIYLCHVPCFYFVSESVQNIMNRDLNGNDTFRMLFFGLLLTACVAEISFRFLESPIRNYGRKFYKNNIQNQIA